MFLIEFRGAYERVYLVTYISYNLYTLFCFTVQITDMSTLQNLLAAHGSTQFQTSNGETVQIITVQNPQDIINAGGVAPVSTGQKMWQLVPGQGQEVAQVISADDVQTQIAGQRLYSLNY